ncbi:MAG: NAAT family transporter [Pseudobacteriovorax sp.]|nr:NAAT family transporter [Pseudobacteriovorax sp.]
MTAYLTSFLSVYTSLIVIIDPFALVPIFLTITEGYKASHRNLVCLKAVLISGSLLILFALTGRKVFELFGISIPAFQIAGGILLLILGLSQLEAHRERVNEEEKDESIQKEDVSIFPLATPLLAGPGAISTVILQVSQKDSSGTVWVLLPAIIASSITCYLVLRLAPLVQRALGQTGLNLVTRIMGVLLTAIAIQFIIDGIKAVVADYL